MTTFKHNGLYLTFGGLYLSKPTPNPTFIIEIDTTKEGSASDTMIIPIYGTDFCDCVVDWGDGTADSYSGLTPNIQHTYDIGGEKIIKINGIFPRISFHNTGDKNKLIRILNWGNYGKDTTNQDYAFYGCNNLYEMAEDIDFFNSLLSSKYMFRYCSLSSLPDKLRLDSLTDGQSMFKYNELTVLPPDMKLDNLTNGYEMFGVNQLSSLPINMKLDNLITGYEMFTNNVPLTFLPNNMTLPLLSNGKSMFNGCRLTSLPDNMTLPSLTNGIYMFNNCTINTTDYSNLLIEMSSNNISTGVQFNGGYSKYNSAGNVARNELLSRDPAWTISDGGIEV